MAEYGGKVGKVRFLTLYVKEANPIDSWSGGVDGYRGTGARLPQVKSDEDMKDHAEQFIRAHNWPADVVLDSLTGDAGLAFTGLESGALWLGVLQGDSVVVPSKPPPQDYVVEPVREWLASNVQS